MRQNSPKTKSSIERRAQIKKSPHRRTIQPIFMSWKVFEGGRGEGTVSGKSHSRNQPKTQSNIERRAQIKKSPHRRTIQSISKSGKVFEGGARVGDYFGKSHSRNQRSRSRASNAAHTSKNHRTDERFSQYPSQGKFLKKGCGEGTFSESHIPEISADAVEHRTPRTHQKIIAQTNDSANTHVRESF